MHFSGEGSIVFIRFSKGFMKVRNNCSTIYPYQKLSYNIYVTRVPGRYARHTNIFKNIAMDDEHKKLNYV